MELVAADESGHILLAVVNDLPLTANTFVPTVVPPTKPQCQISTALSRHKIKLRRSKRKFKHSDHIYRIRLNHKLIFIDV